MLIRSLRLIFLATFTLGLAAHGAAQRLTIPSGAPAASAENATAQTKSVFENLELFAGLDGSKQPQDLGINANMGVRVAANMGFPVLEGAGLGAQVGVALNLSDAAVHVLDQIEGTSRRTQTYVTVGLFQQATSRLSWALGYDYLHENYYDTFNLGQVRGQAGFGVSATDEVGAWFTKGVQGEDGVMGATSVRLDPITQFNAYVAHTWPTAARTTLWAGVASHHHNIVWVLPDNSRDRNVVVYGARLELPLSGRFSVTGSGNFLTPAATGTVDAYLGLTFYPGRGRTPMARSRFSPPLVVGNNPEFPVDLNR